MNYDTLIYSQILQILKGNPIMIFCDQDFSPATNYSIFLSYVRTSFVLFLGLVFFSLFFWWSGGGGGGTEGRNWVCGLAFPFRLFS